MDQHEETGTGSGDNRFLVILVAITGTLVCCCCIGLLLYFGLILSISRRALTLQPPQETPTPIPLVNENPASQLGKFSFGFDGVNDACQVNRPVDTFSQEDLLRNELLYFSTTFGTRDEGQNIDWALYNAQGQAIDQERSQTMQLSSNLHHCAQVLIVINTRTEAGTYILEVMYQKKLAYRQVIHITYSDLSKIPRPKRTPLGEFSLGRAVNSQTCIADNQSSAYSLIAVKNDPWFYLLAPFQLSDIGKKIYLSVYQSNGGALFRREEQTIEDDINLCFWEGFSMEDEPAGKYTVVIEDEQFVVLYKTEFELR